MWQKCILIHIKTIPLKCCWYFHWQSALQKIFFSSAQTAFLLLLACYLSEFYWHLLNLIKGTKLDSYFERRKWKNIQLLFGCRETYKIQQDIFRIISSVVSTFNIFNFELIHFKVKHCSLYSVLVFIWFHYSGGGESFEGWCVFFNPFFNYTLYPFLRY